MTVENGRASDYAVFTSDIVSAFVVHNSVSVSDLPGLIAGVHAALVRLGASPEPAAAAPTPAVPVKRSITPDYLICLEDGKKFKSLKRHLRTRYDLTPDAYRARWGLAPDYPMVAPNYAEARALLARSTGLGKQRRKGAGPALDDSAVPADPAGAEG